MGQLDPGDDTADAASDIGISSPSVEWEERIVSGHEYEVIATVDFDGVERVQFELNHSTSIKEATPRAENEPVTVVGPDTQHGVVSPPDSIAAYYLEGGEEWMFGSHMSGLFLNPSQSPFISLGSPAIPPPLSRAVDTPSEPISTP